MPMPSKPISGSSSEETLFLCGDFLNDYEGIRGHETYRGDLALMYFPTVDIASGRLLRLTMTPMQIRHFRLNIAAEADARWLEKTLNREGRVFGTRTIRQPDNTLVLTRA